MADRLTYEQGRVWLADILLPGHLRELWIRGEAQLDEIKVEGISGKAHQPNGWKDMDVTLSLDLLTDDGSSCYDKLATINHIFRRYGGNADPKVYEASGNPHLAARGIGQVIFAGLESYESQEDDVVYAGLHFVEDRPAVIKAEKRAAAATTATPEADTATASTQADEDVAKDDSNPFADGYKAAQ